MQEIRVKVPEVEVIRSAIDGFIAGRLKAKLDLLKDDEQGKREQLEQEYARENWLQNAAKRVGRLSLVTHAVKYSHPDARGSSVRYAPAQALPEPLVGSAGEMLADDVVGDAAALYVVKFLKLEASGQTLLQRAQAGDAALKAAFCADPQKAQVWCEAFAGITQDTDTPASHTLAKQLYFPLEGGGYHVLAPLYPTSLAHRVYLQIQQDLFSDETKAARDARRKGEPHPEGYREYPNLARRKFGGSNQQNISQLNSERGGVGYLLPSCPPHWDSQGLQPPTRVKTVFAGWLPRSSAPLRELTRKLKAYLDSLPRERTNIAMREVRERFVKAIVDELLHVSESLRQLPPGWSAAPGCRLDPAEACWLDPGRADADEAFAIQCRLTDWPSEVSHRFGNWLNTAIRSDRLPIGDAEHQEWKTALSEELDWLQKELRDE